jgi:hypothetical protein
MLCGSHHAHTLDRARRLLENRDRLVENVKGGLDSAKELLPPLGGEATSQQLLKRCFPARLQRAGGTGACVHAPVVSMSHAAPCYAACGAAVFEQDQQQAGLNCSLRRSEGVQSM